MPPRERRDDQQPGASSRSKDSKPARDAGAYIGRLPERAEETIPGGLSDKDQRVSAVATQPDTVRGAGAAQGSDKPPAGHREGEPAADDRVREAGQSR